MISRVKRLIGRQRVSDATIGPVSRRPNCWWRRIKYRLLRRVYLMQVLLGYAGVVGLTIVSLIEIPLIGWALLAVLILILRKGRGIQDAEYGAARWTNLRDLVYRGYVFGKSGVVVGRVLNSGGAGPGLVFNVLTKYPPQLDELAVRVARGLQRRSCETTPIILPDQEIIHSSVYGRTSSGKSTSQAIPNLLIDNSSAIVIDAKGELAAETALHRTRMMGHEVICVAPFGGVPAGFEAQSFNPLSVVNLSSPHLVSDAIHFAKALIRPDKQDHNPFFIKSAIIVLDAVLSFLFCHAVPSQCNLQKLREITVNPQALMDMANLMSQSEYAGGYLKIKAQQLLSLTGKTLMDVLATLNTQLFWIDSIAIEQATHWTTFQLQKLLDGRMSIFFIFPTDRVEDYSALIRCWITAIAHAIFAEGIDRPHTTRFYFDEASLLGQDMPVLERMLTKGRAYGIRTNFYWQSLHQIQEVFPDHQAQIFREQMSVEQFMEVSNYQSAKEISQWIGQTTIRVANESRTSGWSESQTSSFQPSSTWGTSSSSTSGYQKAGRALIQPEELLQLPADVTVVLKPQCPPILARKLKSYVAKDREELLALRFGATLNLKSLIARRLCWLVILMGVLGSLIMMGKPLIQHAKAQLRGPTARIRAVPPPITNHQPPSASRRLGY